MSGSMTLSHALSHALKINVLLTKPDGDKAKKVAPAVPPGCSPSSTPTCGYAAADLGAQTPQHNSFCAAKLC